MVVTTIQKKINTVNCWRGGNGKEYIVHHDVGVKGQTAKNNIDYFNGGYRGASAHYFVDRTSIWQLIDDNDCAWHVGDGNHPKINNRNSIGIEYIVEKDGTIHPETKENGKWLTRYLMDKYKIPNEKNVRHFDASGKNCPQFMNRDGKWTEWKEFYKYLTTEDKPKMITKEPTKRHKVRVYWFTKGSDFYKQLEKFLKENEWNYDALPRESDGKVKVEIYWFKQNSSGKNKLVNFLQDYGYNHDVTLEA